MTDDELTDAVIVRRVFPPAVRKALRKTVSELDREAGMGRKSKKKAVKPK
jgi:hypothetical protein